MSRTPFVRQREVERKRRAEERRPNARERGYNHRWGKASRLHRQENPLCRYCERVGLIVPADLVDHLYPHRGDEIIFWCDYFWVSSCQPCHRGFKQSLEADGDVALDNLARSLGMKTMSEWLAENDVPLWLNGEGG